jgi:hypothetical protein
MGNQYGSSVTRQIPSFELADHDTTISRLPPMLTGSNRIGYQQARSIAPSDFDRPTTPQIYQAPVFPPSAASDQAKSDDTSRIASKADLSGVFAKGQLLPLAFHVLPGPMKKLAEMTITVSSQ